MKLLITIMMLTAVLGAFAHEGHNHEASVEAAPRGGILRDALPHFKSEVVINKELVKLYIYDTKLQSIVPDKETLKGDVQFPREKKPREISFKLVKSNKSTEPSHYETKITKIDKVHRFDMHVIVEVGDKKGKADFGIDNIH